MADRRTRRERAELHETVELYGKMVYRLALRIVRNREDAEDAAQEVFVKYVQARRRATISQPRAWLAITALNTARNTLRHEQNRRRRQGIWAERSARERAQASAAPPTDERDDEVWRAVDTLPSELKFPLLLHYQEGLKYREIAAVLECPPGTIANRISTAKARIKTLLQRQGGLIKS